MLYFRETAEFIRYYRCSIHDLLSTALQLILKLKNLIKQELFEQITLKFLLITKLILISNI